MSIKTISRFAPTLTLADKKVNPSMTKKHTAKWSNFYFKIITAVGVLMSKDRFYAAILCRNKIYPIFLQLSLR